jgi:hypothetical protein
MLLIELLFELFFIKLKEFLFDKINFSSEELKLDLFNN